MAIEINGTTGISGVDGSAATPALQGADTNTGISFGTDEVSINTGGTERVKVDSSGNLKFDSGYGSVTTAYGCRAWVNFDGTGTVAIRASGNVSSITDNGTGDYTVNFTTALADANYSTCITGGGNGASAASVPRTGELYSATTPTTSSTCRIWTKNSSSGAEDSPYINVAIFR